MITAEAVGESGNFPKMEEEERMSLSSMMPIMVVGALFWATSSVSIPCAAAETPKPGMPLGHPDFYPSAERPLGWRGDGNGWWPGATPVGHFDSSKNENIVWKTPLSGPSFAQPLVLGEKVITLADPNVVICVNVHTGKVLWETVLDHTSLMPPALAKEARQARDDYEAEVLRYGQWREDVAALQVELNDLGCKADLFACGWRSDNNSNEGMWHGFQRHLASNAARRTQWDRLVSQSGAAGQLVADLETFSANKEISGLDKGTFVIPVEWVTTAAILEKNEKVKTRLMALVTLMDANGYRLGNSGNETQISQHHPKWKHRRDELKQKYSLWSWGNWYGFITGTYQGPCSDGQHIYVAMMNFQYACLDLDGKIKWMRYDPPDWKARKDNDPLLHTRFVNSPFLYKEFFITRSNGDMSIYRKTDGRLLWMDVAKSRVATCRPCPEAGHGTAMTLSLPGGQSLDIVIDPLGVIYRLADGKELGSTGDNTPESQVVSYLVHQDIVVGSKDNGMTASRLKAVSADSVSSERLWQNPKGAPYNVWILYQGMALAAGKRLVGRKLPDGETVNVSGSGTYPNYGWAGIGGTHYVYHGGPMNNEPRKLPWDIVDLATGRTLSQSLMVDARFDEDKDYRLKWAYRGAMNFVHTGMQSFQANRMFVRSRGYLWCIGDPKQSFRVPRNCPPQALVK